jgi:hypothetical protein
MKRLIVACAVAAMLSAAPAAADPMVSVYGGDATLGSLTTAGTSISGDLTLGSGPLDLLVTGLQANTNYQISLALPVTSLVGLTLEVFNDVTGRANERDPNPQPIDVPDGWSTSTDYDGFSFAQRASLDRSLIVGSTSFALTADETTDARDLLAFSGLATGAGTLSFGLRDWDGNRSFLIRITATFADAVPTPEPASMLLLGAGLLGTVAEARRRSRKRQAVREPRG